ncbi:unnamed protein product [Rotaria sordida]|uniref:Uncharacterized protein n=1 Tax=Rotaria sordida TaxID=392033 RepID=A0A818QVH8_9BILA|nr:unnamed protein product [Rotaria sordida]
MTTPPVVSTTRSNDRSTSNDDIQTDDQISTLSHSAGTSIRQQATIGSTETRNSVNPTFAVLKATTFQQALGHPLTYARVLMQMGYEPLPAYRGKTLFGKEAVFYPNVFQYLKYIHKIDGFTGLYRGFGYTLLSKVVCWYTTTKVDQLLEPVEPTVSNDDNKPRWDVCIKKTLREVRCQSWGILLSHPFQVMAIRSMGQFIGRENVYSSINIFQNVQEIYNKQGIGGFFVGLIPRWLLEIATIIISNVLIHMLKTQLPTQNEMIPLYEYLAAFVAQTATYPLSVITTVMTVNQSGLRAGMLPISPVYPNWQDAYKQLSKTEQLKRGSSFFNRVAIGAFGLPTPGTPIPNA